MYSFEKIVEEHSSNIYAVALMMVNNEFIAKDITQDVFIRIHKGLKNFKGTSAIATWIYRITKNVCYDYFQKEKKNHDEIDNTVLEQISNEPEPAVQYENQWKQNIVRKSMSMLSKEQRMVLSLYYFSGNSYEEISNILRIPSGTVKSHIHRGKKELKHLLGPVIGENK